jgi:small basic protein
MKEKIFEVDFFFNVVLENDVVFVGFIEGKVFFEFFCFGRKFGNGVVFVVFRRFFFADLEWKSFS